MQYQNPLALRIRGEFDYEIINGYRVFASNPYTTVILAPAKTWRGETFPQDIVVAAKVELIAVCGQELVCGQVAAVSYSEVSELHVPGYFLIDTRAGETWTGLSREELQGRLSDRGVRRIPWMRRP